MSNLIKLIVKNLIAISLGITLALAGSSIINEAFYFAVSKFYPCPIFLDNDLVSFNIPNTPRSSLYPKSPSCIFYTQKFEIIFPLAIGIILLIIWYLLLRKLFGKFIK